MIFLEQKCWSCKYSIPYKGNPCSWAMRFQPVDGWTATPTIKEENSKYTRLNSYSIRECPLYEKD